MLFIIDVVQPINMQLFFQKIQLESVISGVTKTAEFPIQDAPLANTQLDM
jgi:hypothetical protein